MGKNVLFMRYKTMKYMLYNDLNLSSDRFVVYKENEQNVIKTET